MIAGHSTSGTKRLRTTTSKSTLAYSGVPRLDAPINNLSNAALEYIYASNLTHAAKLLSLALPSNGLHCEVSLLIDPKNGALMFTLGQFMRPKAITQILSASGINSYYDTSYQSQGRSGRTSYFLYRDDDIEKFLSMFLPVSHIHSALYERQHLIQQSYPHLLPLGFFQKHLLIALGRIIFTELGNQNLCSTNEHKQFCPWIDNQNQVCITIPLLDPPETALLICGLKNIYDYTKTHDIKIHDNLWYLLHRHAGNELVAVDAFTLIDQEYRDGTLSAKEYEWYQQLQCPLSKILMRMPVHPNVNMDDPPTYDHKALNEYYSKRFQATDPAGNHILNYDFINNEVAQISLTKFIDEYLKNRNLRCDRHFLAYLPSWVTNPTYPDFLQIQPTFPSDIPVSPATYQFSQSPFQQFYHESPIPGANTPDLSSMAGQRTTSRGPQQNH